MGPRGLVARARSGLEAAALAGLRHRCPICGARLRRFAPSRAGSPDRGRCPRCGSLQRHRHLWLYLERRTDLLTRPQRVLHFAPERGLERRLARLPHLDYLSGDLEPGAAMATLDITRLDLPDESFDCVLCYHVLEHVSDDLAAMRELHRVLRPGGWGVVQVPTYGETTVEDPTVTDPAERRERFGQEDHVRLYGRDFLDRLRSAGFEVTVEVFRDSLTPAERARFGLRFDYDLGIDFNELPQAWEVFRCDKPRRV